MNPGLADAPGELAGKASEHSRANLHDLIRPTPFFLPAAHGQRFCLLTRPGPARPVRSAVLYVHPFGDEMNRTRRMAALQARALAAAGSAVLQIDLHGCGDSSGDFADALWPTWIADLALAHAWLAQHTGLPVTLWGLRLGALLALDYVRAPVQPVASLLLWQPVLKGDAFLTQFLRLRVASGMLAGETSDGSAAAVAGMAGMAGDAGDARAAGSSGSTAALRTRLREGRSVEVGGYELTPALGMAIDALDAAGLAPQGIPVDCFEVVADPARSAPATGRLLEGWRRAGVDVRLHQATGPQFWSTAEIAECPALIDATLAALGSRSSGAIGSGAAVA